MTSDKDRLIWLINKNQDYGVTYAKSQMAERKTYIYETPNSTLADCILDDGWIRPPCKIGDTVYYNDNNYPHKRDALTFECLVSCFDFDHEAEEYIAVLNVLVAGHFFKRIGVKFSDFGQTVFPTKEEAKAVLKEK